MRILDATAGNRAMWFDRGCPLVTFCDLRREVKPDVVCDVRGLPFDDGTFDLAVFDPPHVNVGGGSRMSRSYGHFTASEIESMIRDGAVELERVLKPGGLLVFKWGTHDRKLETVLGWLGRFEALFGQRTASRVRSETWWVVLRSRCVEAEPGYGLGETGPGPGSESQQSAKS